MAAGPLMCWDFFMEAHFRRLKRLEDLQALKRFSCKNHWKVVWNLEDSLVRKGKVILVTDPSFRICFATSNVEEMNGYEPKEIVGKRPSIFQGEKTCAKAREKIRRAVSRLEPFQASLINYRKDGSLYNCAIEAYPVYNKEKKLAHFIAFEQLLDD